MDRTIPVRIISARATRSRSPLRAPTSLAISFEIIAIPSKLKSIWRRRSVAIREKSKRLRCNWQRPPDGLMKVSTLHRRLSETVRLERQSNTFLVLHLDLLEPKPLQESLLAPCNRRL